MERVVWTKYNVLTRLVRQLQKVLWEPIGIKSYVYESVSSQILDSVEIIARRIEVDMWFVIVDAISLCSDAAAYDNALKQTRRGNL